MAITCLEFGVAGFATLSYGEIDTHMQVKRVNVRVAGSPLVHHADGSFAVLSI